MDKIFKNKFKKGLGLYACKPRKNLHTGISINKPKLPVTKHDQTLILAHMYDTSRYTANTTTTKTKTKICVRFSPSWPVSSPHLLCMWRIKSVWSVCCLYKMKLGTRRTAETTTEFLKNGLTCMCFTALLRLSHKRLALALNLEGKSCDLNNQWTVAPGAMASRIHVSGADTCITHDWLMTAYTALFSALLSRLTALAGGSTWVTSFYSAFLKNISWCTYSAGMAGTTWNCSRLGASPVYTIQPCTMSLHTKPHT